MTILDLARKSRDRDGYVRETVIGQLSRCDDPEALPLLCERANDWVPQIRHAAKTALLYRLRHFPLRQFAAILPVLSRLGRKKRGDHRALLDVIYQSLLDEPRQAGLVTALHSEDPRARRIAYQLMWTLDDNIASRYVGQALRDGDLVVRLRAAHRAKDCAGDWGGLLVQNRVSAVRRIGITILGAQSSQDLSPFLLDASAGVRGDARYYLKKRGHTDFAAFYRQRLMQATGKDRYCALLGLGDVVDEASVAVVDSHLHDDEIRMRRAAVRATAGLLCYGDAAKDKLMLALADEASSVSKAAFAALRFSNNLDGIAALIRNTPHAHVRNHAFRLLDKCGKWESIRSLFELAAEPAFRAKACDGIDQWIAKANRTFVAPSATQVTALHDALVASQRLPRRSGEVSKILAPWRTK